MITPHTFSFSCEIRKSFWHMIFILAAALLLFPGIASAANPKVLLLQTKENPQQPTDLMSNMKAEFTDTDIDLTTHHQYLSTANAVTTATFTHASGGAYVSHPGRS